MAAFRAMRPSASDPVSTIISWEGTSGSVTVAASPGWDSPAPNSMRSESPTGSTGTAEVTSLGRRTADGLGSSASDGFHARSGSRAA